MRFRGLPLFCAALLVSACGGGRAAGPTAPVAPTAAASAVSAPVVTPEELTGVRGDLELAEMSLVKDGVAELVLHPDGTLEMPTEQRIAGRLERDGRFLNPQGNLLATLTPEGEVVVGDDEYLPVTIDQQGSVKLLKEGRTVRLLPDGTLDGANPSGPKITITGFSDKTRRTAMFLLVLASYQVRSKP